MTERVTRAQVEEMLYRKWFPDDTLVLDAICRDWLDMHERVAALDEHRDGILRVAQSIVDAGYPSGDDDATIISFVAHVQWLLQARSEPEATDA